MSHGAHAALRRKLTNINAVHRAEKFKTQKLHALCETCLIITFAENTDATCPECNAYMRVICLCGMISHARDSRPCVHCGMRLAEVIKLLSRLSGPHYEKATL
jgi:hypothetical protein